MSLRVPGNSAITRFLLGPVGRIAIMACALLVIVVLGVFTYFYAKYSRVIDEKLRLGPFANNAKIFAGPETAAGDGVKRIAISTAFRL